ncbi:MAG: NrfD/PsrC family molybdoenzyme membrane anchor subunit [Terriglobales bacterium]|jgi:Ni/Fe-hydrogenase subunit HybB-like protein
MATKGLTDLPPSRRPYLVDPPVIAPGHSFASVTEKVMRTVLTPHTPIGWIFGVLMAFGIVQILMMAAGYLFWKGVGIWGITIPSAWGFAIVNFVWWIGIGHAGTLISAILLLLKQSWRTSINRAAEAMTLFAVMCAGMFPILHTGRPWLAAYWLFPLPLTMGVWPQFRSPLIWDVFAVSTYFTVSLLFWFTGLIPDIATLRDNAKHRATRVIYGVLCMGWRGSARHWARYETAYLLLAGLSTPLVLSVHTVVSWDFAIAVLPGWHTTIFPPYFVAGAIYSGFAMVLTLMIPIRAAYGMKDFITMRHLQNMGKVMLATGLIVAYGYFMEAVMSWYSGDPFEMFQFKNRATGPLGYFYWMLITCNIVLPQSLWFRKVRSSPVLLWIVSIIVNIGMWLERFVIVVISLHRDFLPSAWGTYKATRWDYMTFLGTLGFFTFAFLLFIRVLPMISIFELRALLPQSRINPLAEENLQ